jgi:hypothetical protein
MGRLATPVLRCAAAGLVMGLPLVWLVEQLGPVLEPYGSPGEAVLLAICVPAGAALYALVSLGFRSDELVTLWRLVRR